MENILDDKFVLEDRFVAFVDILGFKSIVDRIEQENNEDNKELKIIKSILNFMDEEANNPNYSIDLPIYESSKEGLVVKELGDPRLTYVSDCIIISAEPTSDGFKALSRKIHKITSDLSFDGVFCRGAITKGKLFHRNKILFGNSYIKAYQLEGSIAIFPRVIVDPEIVEFLDHSILQAPIFYGKDKDGLNYLRYWTWMLYPPYAGRWDDYLKIVKSKLIYLLEKNKDNENIFKKYVWLKNEFNSLVLFWNNLGLWSNIEPIQ